ncbi:unnamed protein product [Jaminaea pallidilutea]
MGRKTKLPPSGGGGSKRKIDAGPPAFFRHRKQEQQRQQQQLATDPNAMIGGPSTISKGKQRNVSLGTLAQESLSAAPSDDRTPAQDSSWSRYDHLNASNFQGASKDSSLRAYGRHLKSLVEQSDVLIEVLDARDPMGSRSQSTEAYIAAHPSTKLLFVLTKIDLVPKAVLQAWLTHLRLYHPTLAFKSNTSLGSSGRAQRKLHTQTSSATSASSLEGSTAATLLQLLKNYARSQPKGMSLTVGIFGQPNVGKSSVINSLVRSRACSVAPRPGETKALQTVLLDRKVRLIDSPGVAMGASRRSQTEEVLSGTVKLELIEDPITPVVEILARADPVKITKLYGLPPLDQEVDDGEADTESQLHSQTGPGPASDMPGDSSEEERSTRPAAVDFDTVRERSEMGNGSGGDDSDDEDSVISAPDLLHDGLAENALDDTRSEADEPESRGSTRGVGYDTSDHMDFLLRLALTKGKMLKGGKPDVEGTARGVINDWNAGKITWFVKPPSSTSKKPSGGSSSTAPPDEDDKMKNPAVGVDQGASSIEAPITNEQATVVDGLADAFDIDALFAQGDAQIFGGNSNVAQPSDRPAKAPINQTKLQAADVSASSLGKRGREGSIAESEDEGNDTDDDQSGSESDDDLETSRGKRMTAVSQQDSPTQLDGGQEMEISVRHPPPQRSRGSAVSKESNELGDFLSADQRSLAQDAIGAQWTGRAGDDSSKAPQKKRGQRKKQQPNQKQGVKEMPAYLDRQHHKDLQPANLRKKGQTSSTASAYDADLGLGGTAVKRGEERRKKRKMAKREEARDGGVSQILDEVTLD